MRVIGHRPADRTPPAVLSLGPDGFAPLADEAMTVYCEAMGKGPEVLAARRAVVRRHLGYPGFTSQVALDGLRLAGFCYGYPGAPGQWWRDQVHAGLTGTERRRWLDDDFELVELHVRPPYQGVGVGRALIGAILADRPERVALLSAVDAETPARQLYRSLGFEEICTGFRFAGTAEAYVILGLDLAGYG